MPKLGIDTGLRRAKKTIDVLSSTSCKSMQPCCEWAGMAEEERTTLMAAIISAVRYEGTPDDVRAAALTVVGWLARRKDSERACTTGVPEARRQLISFNGGQR